MKCAWNPVSSIFTFRANKEKASAEEAVKKLWLLVCAPDFDVKEACGKVYTATDIVFVSELVFGSNECYFNMQVTGNDEFLYDEFHQLIKNKYCDQNGKPLIEVDFYGIDDYRHRYPYIGKPRDFERQKKIYRVEKVERLVDRSTYRMYPGQKVLSLANQSFQSFGFPKIKKMETVKTLHEAYANNEAKFTTIVYPFQKESFETVEPVCIFFSNL